MKQTRFLSIHQVWNGSVDLNTHKTNHNPSIYMIYLNDALRLLLAFDKVIGSCEKFSKVRGIS